MTRAAPLLLAALALGACGDGRPADRPPVVKAWSPDVAAPPSPDDWATVLDLAGTWSFRIGDDPSWAGLEAPGGPAWDRVEVPAAWEDQGFFGYDGTAWYRTTFTVDAKTAEGLRTGPPHLLLGRIDDVDEVWLNGTRVGGLGQRPPYYKTASFGFRRYRVPDGLLRDGENVLAVRVYDAGLEGGILEGPVALAVPTAQNPDGAPFVADLSGTWRFSPGDGDWAAPGLDDARWDSLQVPGVWEAQGYRQLGGIAWYRTRVRLEASDAARDLVLVLGKIDDLDETFVNGTLVGRTGDVDDRSVRGDEWQVERAYPVPAEVLQAGENVIAVRVFDGLIDGGIHEGPVGLMTAEAYAERRRRATRDDW